MERMSPVYTLTNECHDCYKCIRICPVKAIKVQDGRAGVIPSKCISCGQCVLSCPSNAKQVRNDIEKVRHLLQSGEKVIVSLAPSWRGAFDTEPHAIISLFKQLGFSEVSETALGAQEVSIETAQILNDATPGIYISSACPVIVDYVRIYKPDYVNNIVSLASPALTHAKMLKEEYGADTKVVFIGPCIGKKNEADRNPELIAAALTFEELKIWMREEDIKLKNIKINDKNHFVPDFAHEGSLYPLDGGMNETIKRVGVNKDVQLLNICSLDLFAKSLNELNKEQIDKVMFIEALACVGGCISGPCISSKKSDFSIISNVLSNTAYRDTIPTQAKTVFPLQYKSAELVSKVYTPEEISGALRRIGKLSQDDELNCSGCGYQTCKGLARALLDGDAEPSMCVSYMRQLATRKADAMFKFMPSAMVLLDRDFNILEANESFIRMFANDESKIYLFHPDRLVGQPVTDMLSFSTMFKTVLKTGEDIHKEHYPYKGKLYDLYIFCVEKGESIGVLITDITQFQGNKEKIAQKAKEVISKNISIVQEIACLLGEHMVETETLLSSIADDYEEEPEGE